MAFSRLAVLPDGEGDDHAAEIGSRRARGTAPVVAMLSYNEYALRQQRSEEIRASASRTAQQASAEVERIVEGLRALLIAVTSMPSVRDLDGAACSDALRSVADKVDNIRAIFVVDLHGKPVCSSLPAGGSTNFADRDYFRNALEKREFAIGTYTRSRISDISVLPLAMPMIEGEVTKAVVVTGIRLDWLQSRISERGIAPGNAVTLADSNGTIVARVPFPERFVGTVIPEPFKHLIHAHTSGVVEVRSQDGTDRILGYRPISLPHSPLYVSAGFSQEEAFGPMNRATIKNVLAIIIGALGALLAAILLGNRFIIKPINCIADVMERWRAGDLTARTNMKERDKLGKVGATLDRLLDELDCRRRRNEQAEEERMLLVRELTHRVKNGFALVQAMARQTFSRSDPDQFRSFSQRLAALAGTYDLILSKEASSSSVRDVLDAALKAHGDPDDRRIVMQGPDVVLAPDAALPLSLVIHELATNATKYGSLGVESGSVAISWREENGSVLLDWVEAGGPPATAPARNGFGSVLIDRAFPNAADATCRFNYRSEGLLFKLRFLAEPNDGVEVVNSLGGKQKQSTGEA
jgi:two-component sensor histidine kinase